MGQKNIFFGFFLIAVIDIEVGKCILNLTFIIYNFVVSDHIGTQIFLYICTVPYRNASIETECWLKILVCRTACFGKYTCSENIFNFHLSYQNKWRFDNCSMLRSAYNCVGLINNLNLSPHYDPPPPQI